MYFLKKIAAAFAILATVSIGSASATVINGNFNAHGYDVIQFHVNAASDVDFSFNGGYGDAMFSLFNSAGGHLITNDDSNSLNPHLTQTLGAGNYSLLVTYCCSLVNALNDNTYSTTDGFNYGSYWLGGTATLAGVTSYLDQSSWAADAAYEFTVTNAAVAAAEVPEPYSPALFGVAFAALALIRRRKQH
ncbi:DVUA0089 family protein [Pseudoduganella sp. OTU4001]|uniref:DVUA0089 family protein n=1 Tax=Pseudoduganella sp. OTU4001 TaxID=3043854 RepID=UPI00313AA28B